MKKTLRSLILMVLLAVPWVTQAQTTTTIVADGSATNSYVPVYGYWADAPQHNQIVYSADLLADIPGVTISGMKFYATSSPSWGITATVSMAIVDSPTLTGLNSDATLTQVWSGSVSFSNNEWSIIFDSSFTYTSGNLLVDIVTTAGSYSSGDFIGIETSYAASYYYYSSSYSSSGETQNFIPKTEFTHTVPMLSCYRPYDVVASNVTSDGVTLSWIDTLNSNPTYSISYWTAGGDTTTVTSTTTDYTISGLEANTLYYYSIKTVCSVDDESIPTNGSFKTDCINGSCAITVASTSGYMSPSYCPTLNIYQNGALVTSVNAATEQVSVCSGDTVFVLYTSPSSAWYSPAATVLDGGNVELFDGSTSNFYTGDTLVVVDVPCPSCLPPTALNVLPDSNEILFSWTPRSGAGQFVVYLDDSVVNDNVTDTFYTFTDLPANTAYTVRVKAVCDADDNSSIASISTRTACGQISLPYSVDFEDIPYNGAWYPCWDSVIHAGTDPSVNTVAQHNSNYGMYFQATSDEAYNLVVSPMVPTAGDNIYVRFWGYNTNTQWFKAGIMSNPHDTTTFIPLVDIVGSSWNEYEFRTDTVDGIDANTNYYIAWMAYKPGVYYSTQMGRVDDVYISEAPSCDRPAIASFPYNVTAHTVDLTWSEVDGANGYIVYYGTVNNINNANTQSLTVSDTVVTLTGLNSETHYYAWVATNCGSSESEARPFDSFTTLVSCPAVTNLHVIDSLTTSDGATIVWNAGGTEVEWEVVLDSNEAESVYDTFYVVSSLEAMTGHTVYVRPVCDGNDLGAARSVSFATGCEDATCNITIEMTDSYGDGWNGGAVNIYQAGVQVGSASLSSGSTGTETIEVCSSASFEIRVTPGTYPSEIAFVVHDGGGSVVYNASAGSITSSSDGAVLATVENPCPSCIMPSGLTVDAFTANDATIIWVAQDGQSEWAVRLDTNTVVTTTGTSYTFTGLEARTAYTAYVATICDNDTTPWASIQFTTDCSTGSCDIYVSATSTYSYGSSYAPSVNIYQNGQLFTTVNNESRYVNVCAGLPVTFTYVEPDWNYFPCNVVIRDGADYEIFNEETDDGGTSFYSTGDTLAYMPNACPTCIAPTGLAVSVMDSAMLEFVWSVADSVSYIVSFNGGAWEDNAVGVYQAVALSPNTAYTFSVKAVCQPGDTSNVTSLTVKTSCGQMQLPYSEDFEADPLQTVPSCWNLVGSTYGNYPGISSSAYTGTHGLTLAADYNDSTTIASSLVPLNGDEIHVSFWASVNQGNTLYAGVMTDLANDSSFIPLLAVPYNNSTYTLYEFNTTSLPFYEVYCVAFRLVTGGSNHYADIDDVNISMEQGCSYPSNLTAVPGAHTIDLVWSSTASSPDFVIEYHDNNNSVWTTAGNTFDTTYTVTGLNAATIYYLRVGLICGNDTLWANTNTATTCDLVNLPYYEEFDSPTGTLPPCWDYTAPSYFHWNRWTTHAETSGDGELMVGGGSAGEYAILPEFNTSLHKIQISFKAKLGNVSEGDSVLFGAYDAVTGTVHHVASMAIAGQSRENFVVFTFAYTDYYGLGTRIAIGHSHNNPSDWGMAVDSIVVVELPDCVPPTDLEVHNTLYPHTADDIYFTWTANNIAEGYQIYIDTITSTVNVDSIPDSLIVNVDTNYYHVPFNSLAYGAHYRFFVRTDCGYEQGDWVELQNGFATNEIWMNNSNVADTAIGCDFIIYDNGGPVAGYLHNSNSTLVLVSGDEGRELQVQGGWFSHGADANTITIYDGTSTSGDMLWQRSEVNLTETIDTVIATSTTGALTITFTSGYYAALGYELYVHCVGTAACARPIRLHAVMTEVGQASIDWEGTAASYRLYYKISDATVWDSVVVSSNSTVLNGLTADTNYDFYVVADCDTNGFSTPSVTVQLYTHYDVVITPCDPVTDVTVSNVTNTTAVIGWTSTASEWEIELTNVSGSTTVVANDNPYTLTELLPNMQYSVRVRALCDGQNVEPNSEWSDPVTFTTNQNAPTNYTITVVANNANWGTVTGSGVYVEGSEVEITATANNGYYFDRWSDGDTNAVRTVVVTANATYTANFAEEGGQNTYYTITVQSNNPDWGTVEGGGSFVEGSQTVIRANANEGYHFVQWQDGNTDNPRTITVIEPATYTATFAPDQQPEAIDVVTTGTLSLYPNPASSVVTLTAEGFEGQIRVDVVDMNGRTVYTSSNHGTAASIQLPVADLPQGAYFVRVTSEQQSAIRKLIVK